jgi:enoyl-CoA hydratase/carnithine racemase
MNAVAHTNDATAAQTVNVAATQPEPTVLFRVIHRVAIITLNRPTALNALSHGMVLQLAALIERCRTDSEIVAVVLHGAGDKGFCAGGDVRALHQAATNCDTQWRQFFIDEYRLDFVLHKLVKPLVVLMDGVTMSGGMGLAQGASLRIVTERTKIAMPETRLGFVPDVGATRFLGVMSIELELYIGLTGVTLSGPDAISCGLADAYAPSSSLEGFEKRLQILDRMNIQQSLRDVFVSPSNATPHAPLTDVLPLVREHFSARFSVIQIAESIDSALKQDRTLKDREWLQTTLEALRAHSPLMLNVTREALLRGRRMTLEACFRMELDLAIRAIGVGDFCEGVRAFLIDKDRSPCWMFRTLEDVNPEVVKKFFSPFWRDEEHPLRALADYRIQ